MRFICALIGMVFMSGVCMASEYQLMVFGDSLSAGYRLPKEDAFYTKLQQALHSQGYTNIVVLNESKSGETTTGGLRRLPAALNRNPDAVLLELGINDVIKGGSMDIAQENLQKMINEITAKNIPVMLIGMELPALATPAAIRAFSNMYSELAQKNGLILYPNFMKGALIFNPRMLSFDMRYVLSDGVHPNKEGVEITVKNILPTVIKFLQENGIHRN